MTSQSPLILCLCAGLAFIVVYGQIDYKLPDVPQLDGHLLEVYDGYHFEDMATYTNDTFRLPTLLVLYKTSCKARAQSRGLIPGVGLPETLPPPTYLTYASHNYESWERSAWFQYSEAQSLVALYNITSCPTALFWEGGASSKSEPVRWTEQHQLKFTRWLETKLLRAVKLKNDVDHDVEFLLSGDNGQAVLVEAGSEKGVQVVAAWKAPVIAKRPKSTEILHAWYVSNDVHVLQLKSTTAIFSYRDWMKTFMRNQELQMNDIEFYRPLHTERHKLLRERPVELQNVTEKGYIFRQMSNTLLKRLQTLYSQSTFRHKVPEYAHRTVLNQEESDMTASYLSDEDTEALPLEFQPLVEEWCKCKVVPSVPAQFRTYGRNSKVRMHVDGTSGEEMNICIVMQVLQESRGDKDWDFSMIGHDGLWHSSAMSPGDMVIFEASTTPHGRLTPLQAEAYVNAFVWYRTIPEDAYKKNNLSVHVNDEL